jgi:hypothetical protein
MQGESLVAAGPYRYVRNPLYLGSWLLACGVSILMPAGGAAIFLVAYSLFTWLLILGEERFLSQRQGAAYEQYVRSVPRIVPRLRGAYPAAAARPRWGSALLAETYGVTVTGCFAVLAWRYNARLLLKAVIVCYGLSLVARAVARPAAEGARPNWY